MIKVYVCNLFSASLSINVASISALLTDTSPRPFVTLCVCVSVCPETVLWQNACLDPDAVWSGE